MVPWRSSRTQGSSSGSTPGSMGPSSPPSDTSALSSGDDSGSDFEATARPCGKRGRQQGPDQSHVRKCPRMTEPNGGCSSASTVNPEPNTLFEAIKSAKIAMETVVVDWLETYKRDRETGFLELINFIVCSCGCQGVVTPQMFRDLQNSEIIQQLTEQFKEDSSEYPLSLNTRPWRRFRDGFCELLTAVVQRCQYSIIYDEFLMGSLISFLISLTDSQVRAFRHTSTLAGRQHPWVAPLRHPMAGVLAPTSTVVVAMKVMSALVKVALGVSVQQENNLRQYEAERSKGPGRRATEKLEALMVKRRELREQQEEIENMMNAIFKGVFVHRYRDVVPDIRAICMEELGTWMKTYAASFLTDSYLKYIGWTLYDKQGEVRLQCVKALQGLYGHRDTAANMELFTRRFKTRMVSMVLDKELSVAVEVVKLLTLMLENMGEALTDEDCQSVYPIVFVANRPLAAAAGIFLYRRLLDPQQGAGMDASYDRDNRAFFQVLLTFFIEIELHEHAAYLVDSLWDCAGPRLRDWETISALLLEESPAEGLGDQQEKALVEILAASVVQATEGQPPVGREPAKKPSSRERKAQMEERIRLTHCLIPALPKLLGKFSADADKAAPLLEVLCCFDLSIYCTGRLEKYLVLVLEQLEEVVQKHTEQTVLEAASRALHALCDPELALQRHGDRVRSRLADQLADKFNQEVTEMLQALSLDDEEAYSMAATLKRISILFNAHDLTRWQLFDPCTQLLQRAVDTGEVPPQVLVPTITCLYFHILWEVSSLPTTDVPEEQLQSLKTKVITTCSLSHSCLSDVDSGVREQVHRDLEGWEEMEPALMAGPSLCSQAFRVLSDLLLVLGPQLAEDGREELAPLVLRPDAELQSQLAAFLMDHVFYPTCNQEELLATENSESRIEELHQRRVLLAGFCKLIIYGVLELSAASDVFKHYTKIDRQEWARTLLLSLQQLMTELLHQEGPNFRMTEAFPDIRDLARRFSLFFSLHKLRSRPLLVNIHKEGILFAFQKIPGLEPELPPLNLPFLEVLSEFSPWVLGPDKALLLTYLDKVTQEQLGVLAPGDTGQWQSLVTYRNSLQPQDGGGTGASSRGAAPTPHPTKRRRLEAPPQAPDSSPRPSTHPSSPALTSTMLRGDPRPPQLSPRLLLSGSILSSPQQQLHDPAVQSGPPPEGVGRGGARGRAERRRGGRGGQGLPLGRL
ncbi:cohesin subunit SA-3 isoform 2-T2 [Ara ararauna]